VTRVAGADVCAGIIILVVILIVVGIILKVISWSARVAGGIGQYRTGNAMKKISNQGLLIQPGQYQQSGPQAGYHQGHAFCANCGATMANRAQARCQACGRQVSWTNQGTAGNIKPEHPPHVYYMPWEKRPEAQSPAVNMAQSPAPSNVKPSGMKFCRHCGKAILADSTFCEHCGNAV
jgi:hypothetical protein